MEEDPPPTFLIAPYWALVTTVPTEGIPDQGRHLATPKSQVFLRVRISMHPFCGLASFLSDSATYKSFFFFFFSRGGGGLEPCLCDWDWAGDGLRPRSSLFIRGICSLCWLGRACVGASGQSETMWGYGLRENQQEVPSRRYVVDSEAGPLRVL